MVWKNYCNKRNILYGIFAIILMQVIIYYISLYFTNWYNSFDNSTELDILSTRGKRKKNDNKEKTRTPPLGTTHYNSYVREVQKRKRYILSKVQSIHNNTARYRYISFTNATLYDLMFLEPIAFLKSYKTPCFLTESSQSTLSSPANEKLYILKCIPGFYVAGFTKCGTTDLHARLGVHPEVEWGWTKEPHWWDNYHSADSTLVRYADMFEESTKRIHETTIRDQHGRAYHRKILGDFTPRTAWHGDDWSRDVLNDNQSEPLVLIPQRMHHILPNAKIIFILRDPVERLYSDYLDMTVRHNPETPPNPNHFHTLVRHAIYWWKMCLKLHTERACAYGYPKGVATLDGKYGLHWRKHAADRLRIGIYVVYVAEWLTVFDRENLLFLSFSQYVIDPYKQIKENIFPLLDLGEIDGATVKAMQYDTDHLNSRSLRLSPGANQPMLMNTRTMLQDFYEPYNNRLKQMLGTNHVF